MIYRIEDLPPRIAAKIQVNAVTGCWEWTGHRDKRGYGTVKWQRKPLRTHRVVYTLLAGPISDGLDLDHVYAWGCRSKACCWPAHLEPVTNAENMRRAGLLTTHCPAGHEYTDENTYRPPSGGRFCRSCKSGARPVWTVVLVCPACGHRRTGPAGRYCGDCRCRAANTNGKRCGNVAVAAGLGLGLCAHHAADLAAGQEMPRPATAQVETYARVAVGSGSQLSLDVSPGQKH